jgi:hypothetical protein
MMAAGAGHRAGAGEIAFQSFRWMCLCLALAWLLAVSMAVVSAVDSHPDEAQHIAAGTYYLTQWLPPRADEAALLPSLSHYGYTYLGDVDVSYFLAGKLASLLPAIAPYEHLRFRLFNLLLFLVLIVVYASRRDLFSPFVLLLLTPQLWYVFSYFNNDGFPLFLALLLANAAFGSRGHLAEALSGPWRPASLLPLLGSGVLLGLLVLTKSNYLPLIGFVVFVAFWRAFGLAAAAISVASAGPYLAHARGFGAIPSSVARASLALGVVTIASAVATRAWRSAPTRTAIARGALVLLAAVAVAAPPLTYDRIANGAGPEKAFALSAIAEKHADPAYRPSDASNADSFFGLRLRDKGLALHELLLPPWNWPIQNQKSFTGYYGYMTIHGPAAYYIAMFVLHLLLLAYLSFAILVRGDPAERQLLAFAAAFSGGVVFLSLYHSWFNDFQAQGRYLFPVLAFFAIPFTRSGRRFSARIVPALLGAVFVLSASSFVFVGLRKIPKLLGP